MLNSLNKNRKELERMARLSSIEVIDTLSDNLIQFSISDIIFGLDLSGVVNIQQELDRLDKELKKIESELTIVSNKLNNEQFIKNAPQDIINKQNLIKEELLIAKGSIEISKEKFSKLL